MFLLNLHIIAEKQFTYNQDMYDVTKTMECNINYKWQLNYTLILHIPICCSSCGWEAQQSLIVIDIFKFRYLKSYQLLHNIDSIRTTQT